MTDSIPSIGDRLRQGTEFGTVRFKGFLSSVKSQTNDVWLGIEWDNPSRGKHSGEYAGVSYFKTRTPGSGSFIRANRAEALGIAFGCDLKPALLSRYGSENTWNNTQTPLQVSSVSGRIVPVQTVGFEEAQKFISDLPKLTALDLSNLDISTYTSYVLKEQCPNVIELDLSRNLITGWKEILKICTDLPKLRELSLSHNMLDILDEEHVKQLLSEDQPATHVQNLSVASTFLDWGSIVVASLLFPCLKELNFAFNKFDSNTLSTKLSATPFVNLEILDMSYTKLTWDNVCKCAGGLINLQRLTLISCGIDKVIAPVDNQFPMLTYLNLNSNLISSWIHVDELNRFPSLVELNMRDNPVLKMVTSCDSDDFKAVRSELIARIGNLKKLNMSEISQRERQDAELYYLNRMMKCVESDIKELNPRLGDLKHIYNYEEAITTNRETLIPIILQHRQKKMAKKVHLQMQVSELKMLLAKLFVKPVGLICLTFQGNELDDLRTLDFYGLQAKSVVNISFRVDSQPTA